MAIVQRVLGAYSVLAAIVVGAHFIFEPVYHDGSTVNPVWTVLDWFMAPAVLTALFASTVWKLSLGDDAGLKRYLEANTAFYASAILAIWFFWNWFGTLMSQGELLMWYFIDPLFVVVVASCGVRLWRAPDAT